VKNSKSHPREWVDCSDSFYKEAKGATKIPPTEVGGLFRSNLFTLGPGRLDLNHPPTSVDGILVLRTDESCRQDLNHPPTSVGGISEEKNQKSFGVLTSL